MKTLLRIGGAAVELRGDGAVEWVAGMTINADGSPRAYGPRGMPALDYLANAGRDGNWWGVATHNGETWGRPVVQGAGDPAPGMYVSTTAYQVAGFGRGDPRRYLDSEGVKFVVAPRTLIAAVAGVVIGCRAEVTDLVTRRCAVGVVGDIGPAHHLGEASMAMARFFGLDADPKRGGTRAARFRYVIWPGVAAAGFELQGRPGRKRVAAMAAVDGAVYA